MDIDLGNYVYNYDDLIAKVKYSHIYKGLIINFNRI